LWRTWAAAGSVCLVTLAVWLRTVHFGFVYDDRGQILDNPQLRSWSYLGHYFREHAWAHLAWMPANFYRPLFLVWLRINYALFASDARGWHLASVLLHLLATALVVVLVQALVRDGRAAITAGAIFGLHPAHAESVAWISDSTDLLAAVLVLASVICFLRAYETSRWALAASVALFAASLLVKETAMVVLVAVLLWMIQKGEDVRTPRFALRAGAFLGTALGYLLLRHAVLGRVVAKSSGIGVSSSVATAPSLAIFYTKHLLWPTELSGFYNIDIVHSTGLGRFWLPVVLLVAGAALVVAFAREARRAGYRQPFYLALTLLMVPLLPAFYLPALEPGNFAHDRYLYIPVSGFALLIALAFRIFTLKWPRSLIPMVVLLCGVGVWYAVSAVSQARIWTSDMSLFTRAAEVAPENVVGKVNLGGELIRQQRCSDAVPLLEQVIERAPDMWFAHANLANCYLEGGQDAKAEAQLSIAVQLEPLPELVHKLGMLRAGH
jgi:protein O-mannosyl-transferase